MDKNRWETLASLLHGEASESEGNSWLSEESEEDLAAARRIYDSRKKVVQVRNLKPADLAWNDLRATLSPHQFWWKRGLKYAAIFILAFLTAGGAFWTFQSISTGAESWASISAPNGQISNVTLFDGTNVWLNAGSTLRYKQSFNTNNREVVLDGEAFFAVTKNEGTPFIVHAGTSKIQVHGTQFNVKAYANDSKIATVLIEGQVEFHTGRKSLMMAPGEQVLFSKNTGVVEKNRVNIEEHIAWKGGKIYFNNETLFTLTQQLERWYEVKFAFANEELKSYRFTGVINKERSLEYTLKIIQEIKKVNFEFKNEQILIKDE